MIVGLTRKQADLLNFIADRLAADGVAPSFDEMMEVLKIRSKSGVHRTLEALERRGHIHRIPKCARAIGLGRAPAPTQHNRCPHCGGQIATPARAA